VRYAVQTDGVTWMTNATVSAVPIPPRPAATQDATSTAAQAATIAAARHGTPPRRPSSSASTPASAVAQIAGTSAVHSRDRAKYTIQPPLSTLVSAAHDHDTPLVSPVRRTPASCGRNCGTANAAAATGSPLRTCSSTASAPSLSMPACAATL